MATLSIRLSEELEQKLEQEAHLRETNRSQVAREALADYLRRRERERFTAEIVEAAQHLRNDPESVDIAEEWLPIENEAMEVAEGGAGDGPDKATADDADEPWWE